MRDEVTFEITTFLMDELVLEFLNETNEGLGELEKITLALENDPSQMDYIRDAFRILHTIKGTCGFLGFERMQKVSHAAENVLSKMRDGEVLADLTVTSTLFVALDCIRTMVAAIEESGSEPGGDDSEIIAMLNKCLEGGSPSPANEQASNDDNSSPAVENTKQEDESENSKELSSKKKSKKVKKNNEIAENNVKEIPDMQEMSENQPQELNQELACYPHDAEKEETPQQEEPEKPSPKLKGSTSNSSAQEEATQQQEQAAAAHQTIRIGLDVVDNLMNLVGELVLTRNQLLQQQEANTTEASGNNNILTRLSHLTTDLQQTVMKTRMQPIEGAWTKLPRIVRDISGNLGKKIQLKQVGQDTELDRQVIEFIKDPLMHMVRNSADHGIEPPEDRKSAGKPEMGTIILKAYHQGGYIFIEIADDGRGIDPEKIKNKAIEKGVIDEDLARTLTRDQILQLIFKPGFSTAENVTNVSGRGVGMDVVKTNVEKLGGTIELQSRVGRGSTFILKIPLTLSIISALLVEAGGQIFALPQMSITEILNLRHQRTYRIENLQDKQVIRWRDRLVPILDLSSILNLPKYQDSKNNYVIILQIMNYTIGLSVDGINDSQEIVVKPLSKKIENIDVFSGSTILGNGQVVLIIDQNSFAATAEQSGATQDATEQIIAENKVKETIILIFKNANLLRAVPLALVSRIDEVSPSEIQDILGQNILLYRGQLIPVIGLNKQKEYLPDEMIPILLFADRGYKIALTIDEIVDIIEDTTEIQLNNENESEILGTAVINNNPVSIIDCQYYFKKAYPGFQRHQHGSNKDKHIKNLLLIDDSKFFLNLITPLLSVSGFAVKTASSADEALFMCRDADEKFDVIVSDIEMPEKTGYDFIREVRGIPIFEDVPVVALSGRDSEQEIEKARSAGFYDFVPKSDQQTLIRVLSQIGSQGAVS